MDRRREAAARLGRFRSLRDDGTLRLFVRNLGEGVYITSAGGQVLDANPACLRILGVRSVEDLNALRTEDLVDPRVRQLELGILEREGEVREYELEIRGADGARRTVLDTAYRVVDESTGKLSTTASWSTSRRARSCSASSRKPLSATSSPAATTGATSPPSPNGWRNRMPSGGWS